MDAADPLAGLRDRYVHRDGGRIYMDGNSLGRLPLRRGGGWRPRPRNGAAAGRRLARWIDAPLRVGDEMAQLIGARAGEVIVCDSVTVNLYKLAWAALDVREGAHRLRPRRLPHRPLRTRRRRRRPWRDP